MTRLRMPLVGVLALAGATIVVALSNQPAGADPGTNMTLVNVATGLPADYDISMHCSETKSDPNIPRLEVDIAVGETVTLPDRAVTLAWGCFAVQRGIEDLQDDNWIITARAEKLGTAYVQECEVGGRQGSQFLECNLYVNVGDDWLVTFTNQGPTASFTYDREILGLDPGNLTQSVSCQEGLKDGVPSRPVASVSLFSPKTVNLSFAPDVAYWSCKVIEWKAKDLISQGWSVTTEVVGSSPPQEANHGCRIDSAYICAPIYVRDGDHVTATVTYSRGEVPDLAHFDPNTGQWHLRTNQGFVDFYFGVPGDTPLMGDWDCDGTDTVAMYRESNGFVYYRNSNSFGVADGSFYFGIPGDVPIAGDWNGDGCDSFGIYRDGKVFYRNSLTTGYAALAYWFGVPGDVPFAGDFNGNGWDTVGLYRPSTGFVYYTNAYPSHNSVAPTRDSFYYGAPNDRIVVGDWDDDGDDSVGIFRPSDQRFYLSTEMVQAGANLLVDFGEEDWLPAAGNLMGP